MVRETPHAVQGAEITETRHEIDLDSMFDSLAEDARRLDTVSVDGKVLRPFAGFPRNLSKDRMGAQDRGPINRKANKLEFFAICKAAQPGRKRIH